jgi:hypothetical protein
VEFTGVDVSLIKHPQYASAEDKARVIRTTAFSRTSSNMYNADASIWKYRLSVIEMYAVINRYAPESLLRPALEEEIHRIYDIIYAGCPKIKS